jgi:hypothetical protein
LVLPEENEMGRPEEEEATRVREDSPTAPAVDVGSKVMVWEAFWKVMVESAVAPP